MNKLYILIGEGKLGNLPSSELTDRRLSMRTLRVVSRLFCTLLLCLGMLSCANPLPEELSDDDEESTDTTYVVDSDIKGGGWKDTVYWNFGFGSRKMK